MTPAFRLAVGVALAYLGPATVGVGAFTQITFSSRVDTVRVDVLVTDGRDPVRGLTAADFEVLDNGVPQAVEIVTSSEIPLNVVLALDTSGSVSGQRLAELRRAGLAVVGALRPDDKIALVTFASTVTVRSPLTTDAEQVRRALASQTDTGDTALADAAYTAMTVGESDAGRALVIVFSDGLDTSSFLTAGSVVDTARRSDVVVYAVSVGASPRSALLRDVTQVTGGRVLGTDSTDNLDGTFVDILNEFRQRYLISFSPKDVPASGWHRLDVRVKNRRVNVNARPGYYSGP